ncbi:hypothetical protein BLNAU_7614 [Blattamonas nauphoetae]|uniref:WW domain-containing protein n=1 Tax=Blattamonas nauphoetae TaxID=2049346 RepID=A0ABQ9Y138_9EUKA|nr:hypothetical protein BLNAU_7614 [Blattamonas nauphoetae]
MKDQICQLTHLNLTNNKITELPPTIGGLVNLKILLLSFNNIKELPSSLTQCFLLEELYLNNNKLRFLPPDIGRLIHLKKLDVTSNLIIDLPNSLRHCKGLEEISYGRNPHLNLTWTRFVPLGKNKAPFILSFLTFRARWLLSGRFEEVNLDDWNRKERQRREAKRKHEEEKEKKRQEMRARGLGNRMGTVPRQQRLKTVSWGTPKPPASNPKATAADVEMKTKNEVEEDNADEGADGPNVKGLRISKRTQKFLEYTSRNPKPKEESEPEEDDVPQRIFFMDHEMNSTSWIDPRFFAFVRHLASLRVLFAMDDDNSVMGWKLEEKAESDKKEGKQEAGTKQEFGEAVKRLVEERNAKKAKMDKRHLKKRRDREIEKRKQHEMKRRKRHAERYHSEMRRVQNAEEAERRRNIVEQMYLESLQEQGQKIDRPPIPPMPRPVDVAAAYSSSDFEFVSLGELEESDTSAEYSEILSSELFSSSESFSLSSSEMFGNLDSSSEEEEQLMKQALSSRLRNRRAPIPPLPLELKGDTQSTRQKNTPLKKSVLNPIAILPKLNTQKNPKRLLGLKFALLELEQEMEENPITYKHTDTLHPRRHLREKMQRLRRKRRQNDVNPLLKSMQQMGPSRQMRVIDDLLLQRVFTFPVFKETILCENDKCRGSGTMLCPYHYCLDCCLKQKNRYVCMFHHHGIKVLNFEEDRKGLTQGTILEDEATLLLSHIGEANTLDVAEIERKKKEQVEKRVAMEQEKELQRKREEEEERRRMLERSGEKYKEEMARKEKEIEEMRRRDEERALEEERERKALHQKKGLLDENDDDEPEDAEAEELDEEELQRREERRKQKEEEKKKRKEERRKKREERKKEEEKQRLEIERAKAELIELQRNRMHKLGLQPQ